jgi:hypothetical protein
MALPPVAAVMVTVAKAWGVHSKASPRATVEAIVVLFICSWVSNHHKYSGFYACL